MSSLEESVQNLADSITYLANVILNIGHKPLPIPGEMSIRVTGESEMGLIFVVEIPAEPDTDVVNRRLTCSFDNKADQVLDIPGRDAATTDEMHGDQDATGTLSLINIDDAGNQSEARVQTFVLTDTIAPAKPGEMQVRVTGEE